MEQRLHIETRTCRLYRHDEEEPCYTIALTPVAEGDTTPGLGIPRLLNLWFLSRAVRCHAALELLRFTFVMNIKKGKEASHNDQR